MLKEEITEMITEQDNLSQSENLGENPLFGQFSDVIESNKTMLDHLSSYTKPALYENMFNPEKRFEEMQQFILNKDTMSSVRKIIGLYYKCTELDQLLSFKVGGNVVTMAWVIVSFPKNIINKDKDELKIDNNHPSDDVYFRAKILTEKFALLQNNSQLFKDKEFRKEFVTIFNEYCGSFTYFKQWDKTNKLCELIKEYDETNKTIEKITLSARHAEENKIVLIQHTKEFQDKVFGFIVELDPKINREELDRMLKIEHLKEKRLEETYYRLLVKDIGEMKFVYLSLVLREILTSFDKLGGRKVNLESSTGFLSLEDICDYEMITKNMVQNIFTKDTALAYGNYMKTIINKLESPDDEIETNRKWDELIQKQSTVVELFSGILIFVLSEINQIKESIMDFIAHTAYTMT